jgi:hypothetical protein
MASLRKRRLSDALVAGALHDTRWCGRALDTIHAEA